MCYTRKAFNPSAYGIASLQWDSAKLYQIEVGDHVRKDDTFIIEKVWL